MPQCSTILPSWTRKNPTERQTACVPVGSWPMKGPSCVPSPWTRVATTSPSATMSWMVNLTSGKAPRNIPKIAFTPSNPGGEPGGATWST